MAFVVHVHRVHGTARRERVAPAVFGIPSQEVSDKIHVFVLWKIVGGVYAPKVSRAVLHQQGI